MLGQILMLNVIARARFAFCLLVCLCSAVSLPAAALPPATQDEGGAQDLRLIPFPKSVVRSAGSFTFDRSVILEISGEQAVNAAQILNAELQRAGLPEISMRRLPSAVPAFRISAQNGAIALPELAPANAAGSYALEVRTNEIVGTAKDAAGLFYGVQTLCQLIRANRHGNALPGLKIRDWPSLAWRCFQDDMTRGPSSTLDTLKFEASLASYFKLNLMTYYMEYQFAFKKHPEIGPTNGSLMPEELTALVDYLKPLHLDLLGNQQSFGHFGRILSNPAYAAMRETADVVTPVHDETYQLLDDFYSEVCPLLPFPWFNVCCDETDGLGTGPSRELASKIGVGGVYVQHIRRLHDLLRDKYKKRMMMWGDIITQHPANLANVPKDTIMLIWGYDARESFASQIEPFAKSGFEFFVCPGVSDWNRILPDFGVAVTNIHHFVRDGIQQGAIGMLNTDWADDGDSLKAVKWHADAWAAECAWNASATPIEAFNRRIGAVLFGEPGDEFGQAVGLLTRTHRLADMKGMSNARFWEKDFAPRTGTTAVQTVATNVLTLVRPALRRLETCRQQTKCNQQILDDIAFGARRMELMGQRMLDGLAAAQLDEQVRENPAELAKLEQIETLIRQNRDAHERMGRQFAKLWLAECKPYALDWTLAKYTNVVNEYEGLLQNVAKARRQAEAGQPLPSAEELGLAAAKPLFRWLKPAENAPTPLAPELPWADASATHRLGLVVQAGGQNRFDLPVEVELAIPANLASKPVRAFLVQTNAAAQELLAQMHPLSVAGKVRLVFILPGALAQGTEAAIQVYLGSAPPTLPGAVRTVEGTNGMRWIENDQVRLLLGPEGAHVYRWELKLAGGRDFTMPGESGWTGFNDNMEHRDSVFELTCQARGPAMVEYACGDASGINQLLRLYGGTSWIEVQWNEPVPSYWNYDNPKNFAADGPTPGHWLFSDGQTGAVGKESQGVAAQVKGLNTFWCMKYNDEQLALGLVTPETATLHIVAPGAGAGGVGSEGTPARHFVVFGGKLIASPEETMSRLQSTLDLQHPVSIRAGAIQAR